MNVLPGLPQSATFFDQARATLSLTPKLTEDYKTRFGQLKARLDALRAKLGEKAPQSVCVFDLTASTAPLIYGWNLGTQLQIASIAKLAVLYAAFQLREDVRAVCSWGGIRESKKLKSALSSAWSSAPDPVIKELAPLPGASYPELEKIFDFDSFDSRGDVLPQFRSSYKASSRDGRYGPDYFSEVGVLSGNRCPKNKSDQKYQKCYDDRYKELSKVPFNELLHLMAHWSDDEAATACISLLGLPLIQAMLRHRGLFSDSAGGVWLGEVYREQVGKSFRPITASKAVKLDSGDRSKFAESNQTGTADSLAMLLAALIRGDLLGDGSAQMRAMIDFSPSMRELAGDSIPENAYLFRNLRPAPKTYESKIGILGKVYSEVAYVVVPGLPQIRLRQEDPVLQPPERAFVCVALQAMGADVLRQIGSETYDIVDEINPKPTTPPSAPDGGSNNHQGQ
jgi:Beta-lactamase enzyme family